MRACLSLLAVVVGCAAAMKPLRAQACGGTFCDSGPQRISVDQSGENILFVELDGEIEAHVQIRYQGDPARLAWLVPMPEVPEVTVGSQPLFDALLADSAPVFGVRTTTMTCDGETETSESTGGCGGGGGSTPTYGGVASEDDESGAMMDPIGKTVGSFDVTILQPKTSDEVLQWLDENEFQLPEQSKALIDPYVQGGSVFVAVRMAPGADVQEIHPIVFRYPGTRPSIPIQLTAVAATVDMRIRTFMLGEGRIVPSNYRSVEPNAVRLSWPSFASNYESVVASAVDETGDGLGFVTEYAGPSNAIDERAIHDPRWNADAFLGLDPFAALDELVRQGQMMCKDGLCSFPHPLVLPLLQHYIPAPPASDENAFYGCLHCAEDQVDLAAWDSEAFARDYRDRVIAPGEHARELLTQHPYLTRMLTFMSPDEMTADPAFHVRADLPTVDREHWAQQTIACGETPTFELPDGRNVVLGTSGWPGSSASIPFAERIELIPETGKPKLVLDQSKEIDAALDRINDDNRARVGGVSNLGSRSGAACHVGAPFAQQSLWIAGALLYLLRRSRRRA